MATMVVAAAAPLAAASAASPSSWPSSASRAACPAPLLAPLALRRTFKSQALRSSRKVRFVVKATSSSDDVTADPNKQFDDLVSDVKAKWDKVENKSSVAIYAGGALVTLWLSSTIIGAVNSVPLLPKLLELVGLGYTGWFVYRYLLFKSGRKELVSDVEELKGKITGAADTATGKDEK